MKTVRDKKERTRIYQVKTAKTAQTDKLGR